ncbi:MAG: KEOPS complex subunit Cgi121 [Candidatus Hodarchaeota archaeon]
MIVKEFNIEALNLHFFVGINQIKINFDEFLDFYNIDNEKEILNRFFKLIDEIQNKNKNSVIQFIKDKYILNYNHIFMACYNLQKAFQQNINISSKKKIELLLYLATNRQINKSIEAFGIDYSDLNKQSCTFCIISPIDNLNSINDELLQILRANNAELTLNNQSPKKFDKVKQFFKISEEKIEIILKSYGIEINKKEINLNFKYSALNDLIFEKMALMSLEQVKIKID